MSTSVFKHSGTMTISASTTSDYVQLANITTGLRIINTTASVAWVQMGPDSSVVAAVPANKTISTAVPIAPGATEVFRRDKAYENPFVAVILESGTGKITLTMGEGA